MGPAGPACGWRIRVADLRLPAAQVTAARIGTPETAELFVEDGDPTLHRTGMEIRFSLGGFEQPGDATAWFRLRRPVIAGEWVCLSAHMAVQTSGIGLAESSLHDLRGALGRAEQALLIDRRPGPPPDR